MYHEVNMFFQNEWVQLEATSFKHLDTDDTADPLHESN